MPTTSALKSRPRVRGGAVVAFSFMSAYWVHVALPLALARRGPRLGWVDRRPGTMNRIGLVSVAVGAVSLAWSYLPHYSRGGTVPVILLPGRLPTAWASRRSRNP